MVGESSFLVFFCLFLLPFVIRSRTYTMPEFLEHRYDGRVAVAFRAIDFVLEYFRRFRRHSLQRLAGVPIAVPELAVVADRHRYWLARPDCIPPSADCAP